MIQPVMDLAVLTADKDAEYLMRGLLQRTQSLCIRTVSTEFFAHPRRDPGCLLDSHNFLRPSIGRFRHAVVLLDHQGCGREHRSREELEASIESELRASGWEQRAAAVVIQPELEVWLWNRSPVLATEIGWNGTALALRKHLQDHGLLRENELKPTCPKEAFRRVLREAHKARSPSLFRSLALHTSLEGCVDPAFLKLKAALAEWFGV